MDGQKRVYEEVKEKLGYTMQKRAGKNEAEDIFDIIKNLNLILREMICYYLVLKNSMLKFVLQKYCITTWRIG